MSALFGQYLSQIMCCVFVLNLRLLCIEFVTCDLVQSGFYLSMVSSFDEFCVADVAQNNFVMELNKITDFQAETLCKSKFHFEH